MNNVRILVSRNKREGGYLGRYVSVTGREHPALRRHHRKGNSPWRTLRDGGINQMDSASWQYEPGTFTGNEWISGPVGQRFDRDHWPASAATFLLGGAA